MSLVARCRYGVAFVYVVLLCIWELLVWGITRKKPMCKSKARLDGRTAIITGSNTGIGKETARELSKRGARVILACRDVKKAEDAASEIRSETGGYLAVRKLDLGSLVSVRNFARDILVEEPCIHILVNNAGVITTTRSFTDEGFEMQFGVNYLGHFLLTNLLLPRMKASAPSRIVIVSSVAHKGGRIHFEDVNLGGGFYSSSCAYFQSKLADLLMCRELAKRVGGTGVTVYAVHPGVVDTELGRNIYEAFGNFFGGIVHRISQWFFKTPVEGAQTSVHCAVDEWAGQQTGLYYSDCKIATPCKRARDNDAAQKLWDLSVKLVQLEEPFTVPLGNRQVA